MIKMLYALVLVVICSTQCLCQGSPPWNNALMMSWSADGRLFDPPTVFQDSSGVPSVIRWRGDTLIAAFQWFRQPNPSPTWDRVAVKYSYDNGASWTQPVPIIVSGLPANYQRPFDPTLATIGGDSIRIYFSSSAGMPVPGQDSSINTYSAKSADGVTYVFEAGPRVDHPSNRIIDPAVVYFNNAWHYTAPVGSPQQGAYHYVSPDGLRFSQVADIPSDNTHNWTGNFVIAGSSELRFYGSGPQIWFNSSANGGVWNGYVPTNISGGDPSVVKVAEGSYLMIFVGRPNTSGADEAPATFLLSSVFPNPARDVVSITADERLHGSPFRILDTSGRCVLSGVLAAGQTSIDIARLLTGSYFMQIGDAGKQLFRLIKL